MGKLIFNAQSTPVAPVGENKHTMFVDSCDGKLKMEDSNGCVNNILCDKDISYQNIYNSISISLYTDCSDGDMHITTDCGSCWDPNHNFFLCAKEYNFNTFCIDPNIIVRFCGEGMPIIKAKCFVNCGTINTRTGPLESLECNFLFGGNIINIHNIGSIGEITRTGGNGGGGGGVDSGNGGGYSEDGNGYGGNSTHQDGYDGPYAGGGGRGGEYGGDGGGGNQLTGIGGDGGCGSNSRYHRGGGGGWGIVCGGNGGAGGCNQQGGDGGNGYYGKGGDGGRGWNAICGNGGDSYFGNGGTGNCGGNSVYGNGGGGGTSGRGSGCGGDSYTGNGGNSIYGNGGNSLGGAYGLIISSPVFVNSCIYSAGGNGGSGYCGGTTGLGTDGGYIYINTKNNPTNRIGISNINVCKGCGRNTTYDGFLCVTNIFN